MKQRSRLLIASFLLLVAAIGPQSSPCQSPNQKDERSQQIDEFMRMLYTRGQFNGAILVAQLGKIIYQNAFGKANFQTDADFTPDTPSDIGSVTKQFTAMAIMILAERKKLNYEDPVSKYIPEISVSAHLSQVTLRQLLNHTSGIRDYGDLGIDDSGLDQRGLIATLLKKEALLAKPGLHYRYSNPGYALLGIVVEKISGKPFGDFLEQEIFKPVGMSNTFVYDRPDKIGAGKAVGYGQFGEIDDGSPPAFLGHAGTAGDGGIYSTVDDLFKWDQALYNDQLVSQSVLAQAFAPGRVEEGTSTYGFGWNVVEEKDGSKYLWHQGSHAGFRAFIGRRLAGRVTVIMLTNKGNSKRLDINVAIQNILANKPYVLPKRSGAEKLYKTIHESGIQPALQMYESLKNDQNADYDLGESELNTLGYQLLYGDKRPRDAIAIFKLNTTEHPVSSNAFDSLGEAYRVDGDKRLAILCYQTAVMLDPTNGNAAEMLKELHSNLKNWIAVVLAAIVGFGLIVLGRKRYLRRKLTAR